LLFFFGDLIYKQTEVILKKFLKVFVLSLFLLSSIQSCSWLSSTWDNRPGWMGGEETEKE
tara:strand:+ start:11414 stop:11593 length:180 start_codon:yes stop_codon:yes gene_type:complete